MQLRRSSSSPSKVGTPESWDRFVHGKDTLLTTLCVDENDSVEWAAPFEIQHQFFQPTVAEIVFFIDDTSRHAPDKHSAASVPMSDQRNAHTSPQRAPVATSGSNKAPNSGVLANLHDLGA